MDQKRVAILSASHRWDAAPATGTKMVAGTCGSKGIGKGSCFQGIDQPIQGIDQPIELKDPKRLEVSRPHGRLSS